MKEGKKEIIGNERQKWLDKERKKELEMQNVISGNKRKKEQNY